MPATLARGSLAGSTESLSLIVRQGTRVQSNVTLVLGATGYEDMNFTGTLASAT